MKNLCKLITVLMLMLSGLHSTEAQPYRVRTVLDANGVQKVLYESVYMSNRFDLTWSVLPPDAIYARIGGRVQIPYALEPFATYNWGQFGTGKYFSDKFKFVIDGGGYMSINQRRSYGINGFNRFTITADYRQITPPGVGQIDWSSQLQPGEGMLYATQNVLGDYQVNTNFFIKPLQQFVREVYPLVPGLGYGEWTNYKYFIWNVETAQFGVTPGQLPNSSNATYPNGIQIPGWDYAGDWADWNSAKTYSFVMESTGETVTLEQLANRGRGAWDGEMNTRRAARQAAYVQIARKKMNPAINGKVSWGGTPYIFYFPAYDRASTSSAWLDGQSNLTHIGGDAQGNITITDVPGLGNWTVNLGGDGLKQEDFIDGYHYELGPPDLNTYSSGAALYNQIFVNKTSGFSSQKDIWGALPVGTSGATHVGGIAKGFIQLNRQIVYNRTGKWQPYIEHKQLIYESDDYHLPFPSVQNTIVYNNPNNRETPRLQVAPYHIDANYKWVRFLAGDEEGWGFYMFPESQVRCILPPNTTDSYEGRAFYNFDLHTEGALMKARHDMQPYEKWFAGTTLDEDPEVQINQQGSFLSYTGYDAMNYNSGGSFGPTKPVFSGRWKAVPGGYSVAIIGEDNLGWTQEKTHNVKFRNGAVAGTIFSIKLLGPGAQVYRFFVKTGDVAQNYQATPLAEPAFAKAGYAGRIVSGTTSTTTTPGSVTTTPGNTTTVNALSFFTDTYNCQTGVLTYHLASPSTGAITLSIPGVISSNSIQPNQSLTTTFPSDRRTGATYNGYATQAGQNRLDFAFTTSCTLGSTTITQPPSTTTTPTTSTTAIYNKIVMLGNSITYTYFIDGGVPHLNGMAASDLAHDQFHLLEAKHKTINPSVDMRHLADDRFNLPLGAAEIPTWESHWDKLGTSEYSSLGVNTLARFQPVTDFMADLIYVRLGENVQNSGPGFKEALKALINKVKEKKPSAQVVLSTDVWEPFGGVHVSTAQVIRELGSEMGWPVAELNNTPGYGAGVGSHPDNTGHAYIATQNWNATPKSTTTVTPPTTPVITTTGQPFLTYTNDPSVWTDDNGDLATLTNGTIKVQWRKSIGGLPWWVGNLTENFTEMTYQLMDGKRIWDGGRGYGGAWYMDPIASTPFTIKGVTYTGIGNDPVWGASIQNAPPHPDGSEVTKAAFVQTSDRGKVFCYQTIPKQWDFLNEPSHLVLNHEAWLTATNTYVHRMQVVVNPVPLNTSQPARFEGYGQEEVSVYVPSKFHRRMTMINGQAVDLYPTEGKAGDGGRNPYDTYADMGLISTQNDDLSKGLSIYCPTTTAVLSRRCEDYWGLNGGSEDWAWAIMQVSNMRNLDNPYGSQPLVHEFTIYAIVGSWSEALARVATLPATPQDFDFDFSNAGSNQHSWYSNKQFRIENGKWTLWLGQPHVDQGVTSYRAAIHSPFRKWQASQITTIGLTAAVTSGVSQLRMTWAKPNGFGGLSNYSKIVNVTGDGVEREYQFSTYDPNWNGTITQVSFEVVGTNIPNDAKMSVKRIRKLDTGEWMLLISLSLLGGQLMAKRREKKLTVRVAKPATKKRFRVHN